MSGAARFYLTRRFAVEPEISYFHQSAAHRDLVVVPNLVWDFRSGRVRPYVIGGVGWLNYYTRFPGRPPARGKASQGRNGTAASVSA